VTLTAITMTGILIANTTEFESCRGTHPTARQYGCAGKVGRARAYNTPLMPTVRKLTPGNGLGS
jgi:hypothetical protein